MLEVLLSLHVLVAHAYDVLPPSLVSLVLDDEQLVVGCVVLPGAPCSFSLRPRIGMRASILPSRASGERGASRLRHHLTRLHAPSLLGLHAVPRWIQPAEVGWIDERSRGFVGIGTYQCWYWRLVGGMDHVWLPMLHRYRLAADV